MSCKNDLEWYKSVKETQASVEVTSYGQMDNIRSCGHYIVCGRSDRAMDNIHDVIQLILKPQEGKKLLKTSYTLNELRDLESKIVLITGTRAENRAAVDHFLNVRMWVILTDGVCRIQLHVQELIKKSYHANQVHDNYTLCTLGPSNIHSFQL